jgi:hypothetical protein
MKQSLIHVLATGSAMLFIAGILSWLRSPWGFADSYAISPGQTTYFVASAKGGVRLMRQRVLAWGSPRFAGDGRHLGYIIITQDGGITSKQRCGPDEPTHGLLGFGWGQKQFSTVVSRLAPTPIGVKVAMDYRVVAVPYWFILLGLCVLPGLWVHHSLRQHQRRIGGLCPVCGYDLRASPDRCPECGSPIPPSHSPRSAPSEHR